MIICMSDIEYDWPAEIALLFVTIEGDGSSAVRPRVPSIDQRLI